VYTSLLSAKLWQTRTNVCHIISQDENSLHPSSSPWNNKICSTVVPVSNPASYLQPVFKVESSLRSSQSNDKKQGQIEIILAKQFAVRESRKAEEHEEILQNKTVFAHTLNWFLKKPGVLRKTLICSKSQCQVANVTSR